MKSKTTAGLLAIFLGGLGVHKFYLGQSSQGFFYLIFCWTFIPAIFGLFEGISYFSHDQERWDNKFHLSLILTTAREKIGERVS